MGNKYRKCNKILINTAGSMFIFLSVVFPSKAQITPDTTLPNNSTIKSEENLITIEGGTQEGGNLFHSFDEFSVPTGIEAYFNNAFDVDNIITRVTGTSISNIDGLISTNSTANLFFVNPNGIIFGPNADLNIGGSFIGTTANSIKFADGVEFSASNPQETPLLTIETPIGLSFDGNSGAIQIKNSGHTIQSDDFFAPISTNEVSNSLQVSSGKTLALIGGDILLEGGVISTENGKIELGSVNAGEVFFKEQNDKWFFDYGSVSSFKDIKLTQNSLVYISNEDIVNTYNIQGHNIEILDGSLVLSQDFSQNDTSEESGRISFNASSEVIVKDTSSGIYTLNFGSSLGDIIEINADKFSVEGEGTQIATVTFASGTSGDILINADNLKIIGYSTSSSSGSAGINTFSYSSGSGGDININTKFLTQSNGNLTTLALSSGNAGSLSLNAETIKLQQGSTLGSVTFGTGDGGNVLVNAKESIEVVGQIPSNDTQIQTSTVSEGNAGNLEINTSELYINDGGSITTSTTNQGDGGNVIINAYDSIEVSGVNSSIESSAVLLEEERRTEFGLPLFPIGDAGSVDINTKNLSITNHAVVSVKNDGSGNAGTMNINADNLIINDNGVISASTNVGTGGNIALQSEKIQMNNGVISATAGTEGNKSDGGNITIDTDILAVLENSSITANAFEGRGGNIEITTTGLFISPDSQITATSEKGINGSVQINASNENFSKAMTQIPSSVNIFKKLLLCARENDLATAQVAKGEFYIFGSSGIPTTPFNILDTSLGWYDSNSGTENSQKPIIVKPVQQYVEAQGWTWNPNGTIRLTTEPNPEVIPYGSQSMPTPVCVKALETSQE